MQVEILQENVSATGRVKDDTHGIYMPVVLGLDQVKVDGKPCEDLTLIIYDGSLRGDYYRGDNLTLNGARLVNVKERGTVFKALLVTVSAQISKDVPGHSNAGQRDGV
jgi:hypothetical protein